MYKITQVAAKDIIVKQFEFPAMEVASADYQSFYQAACHNTGLEFDTSYGIYQMDMEKCIFSAGFSHDSVEGYEGHTIPAGEYYEFEIDMMAMTPENNIYEACFVELDESNEAYVQTYSFELMDKSFCPQKGEMKFKYFIKKA